MDPELPLQQHGSGDLSSLLGGRMQCLRFQHLRARADACPEAAPAKNMTQHRAEPGALPQPDVRIRRGARGVAVSWTDVRLAGCAVASSPSRGDTQAQVASRTYPALRRFFFCEPPSSCASRFFWMKEQADGGCGAHMARRAAQGRACHGFARTTESLRGVRLPMVSSTGGRRICRGVLHAVR